jgi:glyoxylase-like metal-dependent hydrolase (beta-lactamase superfamily II)
MHITKIKVGDIRTNCYVISIDNECLLIDPGSDDSNDIAQIKEKIGSKKLLAVMYTHNHYDHIQGGYYFSGCPHYMHQEDIATLQETCKRTTNHYNITIIPPSKLQPLQEHMHIGPFSFTVLHTPGHTQGGVCLYFPTEQALISGDTLFAGTYGRTDLPFANSQSMKKSLQQLSMLPLNTTVYPGHGKTTVLEAEKQVLFTQSL